MNIGAFNPVDRAFLLLSIICGFGYLITQSFQPFPGSVLLKVLSIATLAVIAFRASSVILGTALALSSLGDALLDLGSERFFIRGLLAFLAAHLVYILLFVRSRDWRLKPNAWRLTLLITVWSCNILLLRWLTPGLGEFARPVMVYVLVITVMVAMAITARFSKPWVMLGAILFLISDSILAVNKFKSPVPLAGYLIWATYYLAQYGIAIGFLSEKSGLNQPLER